MYTTESKHVLPFALAMTMSSEAHFHQEVPRFTTGFQKHIAHGIEIQSPLAKRKFNSEKKVRGKMRSSGSKSTGYWIRRIIATALTDLEDADEIKCDN